MVLLKPDKKWNVFEDFVNDFKSNYSKGLPGKSSQLIMKPYIGLDRAIDLPTNKYARKGAVLALIYPLNNVPHLALIQRPDYGGAHSGQISFPGGKVETTDKSLLHAALREANEEVGIKPNVVDIVGPITEMFVLASNFMVYPFVGFVKDRPEFVLDKREVKELLEVPFHHFLQPEIIKEKEIITHAGFKLNAPYFDVNGRVLWGATAMMISEIVAISKGVTF